MDVGGVGAITFNSNGEVINYEMILEGTSRVSESLYISSYYCSNFVDFDHHSFPLNLIRTAEAEKRTGEHG